MSKTLEENFEELMKQAEANDAAAMFVLGSFYEHGQSQFVQQDAKKAIELWTQAAKLGSSSAHFNLGNGLRQGEIQRRPGSTMRLRLWQEMKPQDAKLEQLRDSPETWDKL